MSKKLAVHLEHMDAELDARGVPILMRPITAFHQLSKTEFLDDISGDPFSLIFEWFFEKYGDRAKWDLVIGQQPLVLRSVGYIARIRLAVGEEPVGVTDQIDDLPKEIAENLTENEVHKLCQLLSNSYGDHCAVYNLKVEPELLTEEQWELVHRANNDLKTAVDALRPPEDTQGAVFHSHEAAEKYIKAALLGYGVRKSYLKKTIRHSLRKGLSRLIKGHPKHQKLEKAVTELGLPGMAVRYSNIRRSFADAVNAFNAARHICGFIAAQWQMDAERGAPDLCFESGKFYQDYSGQCYRCISIGFRGSSGVKMICLAASAGEDEIDVAFTIPKADGCFYLPLNDDTRAAALESRYQNLLKAPKGTFPNKSISFFKGDGQNRPSISIKTTFANAAKKV